MQPEITAATDGVQLQKYVEETEFKYPSVVYELESTRDEAVSIRIVDRIPDDVDPGDVGFHPDYGRDHWSVEDRTLAFERELDAGDAYRTVFAVQPDASVDEKQLITDPDEFAVDPGNGESRPTSGPPVSADENESTAGGPVVPRISDGGTGRAETVAGDGDRTGATRETQVATDEARTTGGESAETEETLLDQFVAELQDSRVSEETLRAFHQEVVADQRSTSVDVRIERLQNDIADLRAYTDALEAFLDGKGSAKEVIDRFESRVDRLDDDVESVEAAVDDHDSMLAALRRETQDLRRSVDSLSTDVSSFEDEIADLSAELSRVSDELEGYDIETRFTAIEDELEEVTEFQTSLRRTIVQDS